jgi:predicted MPP superfamily phosphohydrolase
MASLLGRFREISSTLFYRSFFRLLVLASSAGQWACVAWFAMLATGRAMPLWAHALAVLGLYRVNRTIVRRRRGAAGPVLRVYSAVAFVSLFCFGFMLASGAIWLAARGVLGALSAQALTRGGETVVSLGIDDAFTWIVSVGMAGIALAMAYGYTFGQKQLRVTRVSLPLPGLPAAGSGIRIAQISDIHVGQNLTVGQLREFVSRVNALRPDLICITGDIADSPLADCATFFPILGTLRARHGVCAILGNHDHFAGAQRVVAELRQWTDFRVLRDEAVTLDLGPGRLHVIGLDDRGRDWARGVDSDERLTDLLQAAPSGVPVLVLAHRPDVFEQAAEAGVALMLSGHTHGGQLALPWFGGRRRNLAEFITRFDRGLFRRGSSALYVNSGLGVTGQRVRLWTPREISLFETGPIPH